MVNRYVVMGKGVPRSVGFKWKRSAIKYVIHFKKKGKKPKIYRISELKIKKHFLKLKA